MGVQGLWNLLAPVGRRVSVETLAGRKLAIDASIWMIQFMKAMRDEKGEMVRNAHLIGFFRRICKLLFLRTKPVFVFDGGTPALKRRTVIARRRQRENAQTKIRKTAEKLLLNHLKAQRLEEIAKGIKIQTLKVDTKGKQIVSDQNESTKNSSQQTGRAHDQEALDELLAASLAAEDVGGSFTGHTSKSVSNLYPGEEDEGDESEEMILPVMHGKIDPTILASLPPSMQLDLLGQMRERLMAENRQKYQKVKKAPTKFSELQIQAYLKTVAFRREIDEAQKAASGRGVAGVQTSRIASEANREFIFSSSFTGDKQMLTSAGVGRRGGDQSPGKGQIPTKPADSVSSNTGFHSLAGSSVDDSRTEISEDIGTYIDDMGRIRVSRVRGLGIRVTRDLQRNLDMMKEFEQDQIMEDRSTDRDAILKSVSDKACSLQASVGGETTDEPSSPIGIMDSVIGQEDESHNSHERYTHGGTSAIEVSFVEDDVGPEGMEEDNIFTQLVARSSPPKFYSNLKEDPLSLVQDNNSDGEEVDWEEGVCNVSKINSPLASEHEGAVTRGQLEEDADMQEAIRRSLEDVTREKSLLMSSKISDLEFPMDKIDLGQRQMVEPALHFPSFENVNVSSPHVSLKSVQHSGDSSQKVGVVERQQNVSMWNAPGMIVSSESYEKPMTISETCNKSGEASNKGCLMVEVDDNKTLGLDTTPRYEIASSKVKMTRQELCLDESNHDNNVASFTDSVTSHISPDLRSGSPNDVLLSNRKDSESSNPHLSSEISNNKANSQKASFAEETTHVLREQELDASNKYGVLANDDTTTLPENLELEMERSFESSKYGVHANDDKTTLPENLELEMEGSLEFSLDEQMLLLRQEREVLGDEQRKLERNAESVSSEMFAECQELLQMFGLPYIIAPMEAEAQCAYMELANLVDGVVTDDSDVFLFGSRSVYKNIFDDRKYVETYFMKDIESELGLTREKLIRMAMLLGSDYTEGVSGIGVVNAIEVVNAFPEEDGLQKFREWIESPDPAILGKFGTHTGGSPMKRSSKASKDVTDGPLKNVEGSASDDTALKSKDFEQSLDNVSDIKQIFMDKHRNVSKNWHVPLSFPSEAVISAYISPQVDKSTESFSWGKPDLFVLRKLCWERFGWNNQKADELLIPVLKEYNKHETQLRLEAFYTFNERFAKIRSQRIKKAVKGITNNKPSSVMDEDLVQQAKSTKKKRPSPSEHEENKTKEPLRGTKVGAAGNESQISEKASSKSHRKRIKSQIPQSEDRQSELLGTEKSELKAKRGSNRKVRGRGRGSGRRQKEEASLGSTETSSSDDENHTQDENTVKRTGLRRSSRSRNQVKYTTEDLDVDEFISPKQTDGIPRDETTELGGMERESLDENGMRGDANRIEFQDDQLSPKDHLSGDYFLSGGGFCIDEDEEPSNSLSQPVPSSTRESEGLVDGAVLDSSEPFRSSFDESFLGKDCSANMSEPRQEEFPEEPRMMEETTSVTEQPPVGLGLTAMPNLRRKRRRS